MYLNNYIIIVRYSFFNSNYCKLSPEPGMYSVLGEALATVLFN